MLLRYSAPLIRFECALGFSRGRGTQSKRFFSGGMAVLCSGGSGLINGIIQSHFLTASKYQLPAWSPLFFSSPTMPGPMWSSFSSQFSLGEFCLRRCPDSPLLGTGGRGHRRRRGIVRAKARDFYEALNLSRNASIQEIKSSYRNLARKYHPDMNKSHGAEEKFKEISAAYEVLSDEEKRSLYDRYGEVGLQGEYAGADAGPLGVDPFEVFNAFFGQSNGFFGDEIDPGGINFSSRIKQRMGLDIRHDLSLSFEESIFGGQREINVIRYETCDSCNGSGAKSRKSMKTCSDCGGRGGVMRTQKTQFGLVSQVSSCSKCGGSGKIITDLCRMCNGEGKLQMKRSVRIDIPAGIADGYTMQIQGEGSSDKDRNIVGDLYLFIHIDEKPGIRREGLNLYTDISIDYTEAILGTKVKVETVEGSRDLCIPPGTQPGEVLKLSNMGVPNVKRPSIKGDHHFIVRVQIPKIVSEDERYLVEQLASLRNPTEDLSISQRGMFQYDISKKKRRNQQAHGTGRGSNHALWGFIKSLFGGNKTGSNFASISTQAVYPAWPFPAQAEPTIFAISVGVILATCISSVIGKNCHTFFLQQRQHAKRVIKKDE